MIILLGIIKKITVNKTLKEGYGHDDEKASL